MTNHQIKQWFQHRLFAKGARSVHSPWLFELYTAMRRKSLFTAEDFSTLMDVHNSLRTNKDKLSFYEMGSRNGYLKSTVSEVFKRTASSLTRSASIAALTRFTIGDVIELGGAFGTTTLAMHFADRSRTLYSIEGVKEIATLAANNLRSKVNENVHFICGSFEQELPLVLKEAHEIGFAFVDGHHSAEPTMQYVHQLVGSLSAQSIIVIDDIHGTSEMSHCWRILCQSDFFEVNIDFFEIGLLIHNPNLSRQTLRLRR